MHYYVLLPQTLVRNFYPPLNVNEEKYYISTNERYVDQNSLQCHQWLSFFCHNSTACLSIPGEKPMLTETAMKYRSLSAGILFFLAICNSATCEYTLNFMINASVLYLYVHNV